MRWQRTVCPCAPAWGSGLYVFEHDSTPGNAHAQSLFDRLQVPRADDTTGLARDFSAYSMTFDGPTLSANDVVDAAPGVRLISKA